MKQTITIRKVPDIELWANSRRNIELVFTHHFGPGGSSGNVERLTEYALRELKYKIDAFLGDGELVQSSNGEPVTVTAEEDA